MPMTCEEATRVIDDEVTNWTEEQMGEAADHYDSCPKCGGPLKEIEELLKELFAREKRIRSILKLIARARQDTPSS